MNLRNFLQALHYVEAAPAAITLHRIGGIRNHLQFVENELRNHERAVEKAGFGNIGNPAVDQNACIKQLDQLLAAAAAVEKSNGAQIQRFGVRKTDNQSDITCAERHSYLEQRSVDI